MATVQFQLTDDLVSYLSSSGRSLANDFRFALIGGSGGAWSNASATPYQWLGISSSGVTALGNNTYQVTADSATSGNLLFAVSSEISGGTAPTLGSTAPNGAPNNSTSSPLYSLAAGETTFGPHATDNADFSYENSFGLFLNLTAIDSNGIPVGTLINGGADNAQNVYNYGYWGANNPGTGNVVGGSTSTNLVAPLGAAQTDTSPSATNVNLVSNGAYHDFSDYLGYLSTLSGGSVNLDDSNYKAWINYNATNDQYNAYARFYAFENGDPEQDGYIILAGNIGGNDYSYLFPWTPNSLANLQLSVPSASSFNYLKNPNAIYGNNASAIFKSGNFWTSGQTAADFFKTGTSNVNTGSVGGGFPSTYDGLARAPGDLFFGLGYGLLGSASTTFTAADIWTQVNLYDVANKPAAPTELGDLPSQVWYAENGQAGATYNGPVANGIWGGWAHPTYAAAGGNEYWNNYSYMLRGYIPSSYTDYLALNPLKFGNTPILSSGIYAWAMDDRLGAASVQFSDTTGFRFIIGKPWSGGAGTNPVSGNVIPDNGGGGGGGVVPGSRYTQSMTLAMKHRKWGEERFGHIWTPTNTSTSISDAIRRHDFNRTKSVNVDIGGATGFGRRAVPKKVHHNIDTYFSYELSGLGSGGSTYNIFETPTALRNYGPVSIADACLVKFNYSTGQFEDFKDSSGQRLYEVVDTDADGYVDRFDMTLSDGSAYDADRSSNGVYRDLTGYVTAQRIWDYSSSGRKKIEADLINNTIIGNAKGNKITGGLGGDAITGGLGRDHFIYTSINDSGTAGLLRDTITDFEVGTADRATDRLDLRKLGRGFSYIGSDTFTGAAGEVRFANGLLSADTDGDGSAEFSVLLHNSGNAITQLYRSNLLLN